jgi:predicted phosphodiesterase
MNVSRRDFLTSAGGLIAVSSLPSFAKDDPAVFPDRGRFERLTLAYQHIDAGATSPFSILHISDTHFTAAYPHEPESKQMSRIRRTRTFGGHQEEALRDSLAWAKDNVDYVLHTGDLIDWQSEANFDMMKKFFGDNTIAAVGNHEFYTYDPGEKHTWQEPFKERSWKLLKDVCPADPRFNTRIINGVNFVCMDDVFGTVQPDQVEKFHAEVKKGLPIILCMHVPFITPFIWRAQKKFWKGGKDSKFRSAEIPKAGGDYKRQHEDSVTREFIAYLKKETLLKGILAVTSI